MPRNDRLSSSRRACSNRAVPRPNPGASTDPDCSPPPQLCSGDVRLVDRDEARLDRLAARLAFANCRFEALIYLARQQALQSAAIALGERRHDHLVGGAGPGEEVLDVETGIRGDDRIEP